MSRTLFEKKGKRGRTGLKEKKKREEKRVEKQANSQLAQIEFLVEGVPSVK